MNSTQADAFFSQYPCVMNRGVRQCILAINISGGKDQLEAIKSKLASEQWKSDFLADRSGKTVLSVNPSSRTLEQTMSLARRFKSHEFGAVEAQIMAIPAPSSK
ncbi:hypothetical protein LZK98_12145 [Sphingomonas cannabina]|uniref:hypothetical protein n=1 Tax=Sphingomonas cannabina TaxID=2899123 RepID=UPI001F35218D|nr:hypothetical protein [Sphingomonas cannabina]UIJ43843.1 hypothetical protein LZK98_12145 [Sphingomonas cannabina]